MMKEDIMTTNDMTITLKTFFGLEEVLKEELEELGYSKVKILNRAVQVQGTWKDVYFLNLNIRCAITVLVQIETFFVRSEEDLYKKALKIDWTKYFDVDKTFAVKGAIFSDIFNHSQYPFLLVKDAIVDTFRDKFKERPDVNVKAPQVLFDVYINDNNVTISLNTSGVPLFQRGYRQTAGEAPLNEVVAAALIRMSGWDRKSNFIDPFCGSGTLLIEAGMLAANIPSNIERQHYAFKNFLNFDPKLWDDVYESANSKCSSLPCNIVGYDIEPDMIMKTKRNLRGVAVGRFISAEISSFQELKNIAEGPGVMVTNPPYGERMGDNIEEMYSELGDFMKGSLKGYVCWVISASEEGFKSIGLRPERRIKLFNGDLECSFRKFSIYEGSKRTKFQTNTEELN
ncbi:THUMP domain-containing protein [Crocinitomicaceae bacterium]|nr:THUMP domain-containing protein [Crocinitomicaceae bacterium]